MSIASLSNKPDLNLNVGSLNCTALTINGVPPSGTGNFNNPSNVDLSMEVAGTKHSIGGVATINSNVLSINDASNAFTSTFTGGTQTGNLPYTLPIVAPTAGQVLSSDATGVMSWVANGSGGGGDVKNPMINNLDAGGFAINDLGSLVLNDSTQSFTTSLTCTSQTDNIQYLLPGTAPTAGQVLSSDANGAMSWVTGTGGGNFSTPSTQDLNMDDHNIIKVQSLGIYDGSAYSASFSTPNGGLAKDLSYKLPYNYPAQNGYVLSASDTGVMSWVANGTGGGVQNPMTTNLGAGGFAINDIGSLAIKAGTSAFNSSIAGVTQTANIAYTLPATAPTAGQVLSSDASGAMSWIANGSGSGDVKNPMIANLDAGNFDITKIKSLSINDSASTYTTSFIGGTQSANIPYTLPIVAPTAGQVLSSNASGVMSWVANGSTSSAIKAYSLAVATATTWTGGGITNLTTAIDCTSWTYPCIITCNVFQFTLTGCSAPASPASSVPAIYLASANTEAWLDVVQSSSYNATNNISAPSAQAGLNNITNQIKGFTISAYLGAKPASSNIFLNCKPTANATFTSYDISGYLTVQPIS